MIIFTNITKKRVVHFLDLELNKFPWYKRKSEIPMSIVGAIYSYDVERTYLYFIINILTTIDNFFLEYNNQDLPVIIYGDAAEIAYLQKLPIEHFKKNFSKDPNLPRLVITTPKENKYKFHLSIFKSLLVIYGGIILISLLMFCFALNDNIINNNLAIGRLIAPIALILVGAAILYSYYNKVKIAKTNLKLLLKLN